MSHKPKAQRPPIVSTSTEQAQGPVVAIPSFDTLPDDAFIREAQLVRSSKRPKCPAPLPFSGPTLWRKVKAGTFPKPLKLSERITAWKVGDVRSWINTQSAAG